MAKKKKPDITNDRSASVVDSAAATENVHSLASAEFREALERLTRAPTIDAFLHALRIAGNPVEISMLFETIPTVIRALEWSGPEDLKKANRADRWREVWRLSAIFVLVEPIDPELLRPVDDQEAQVQANTAPPPDKGPNPLVAPHLDKFVQVFTKFAEEVKRRKQLPQTTGLRSPYAKLADLDNLCGKLEPNLGFHPSRALDDELAEFISARVVEPDGKRAIPDVDKRLLLSDEHRAHLALLWDAACIRLISATPPDDALAKWSGTVDDNEKDFSLPLLVYLPLALSGLGCLLMAGHPSRAPKMVREQQQREAASRGLVKSAQVHGNLPSDVEVEREGRAQELRSGNERNHASPAHDSLRSISDMLLQHSVSATDAATSRECPEPLASLMVWAEMAAPYGLWMRERGKLELEEPFTILGEALVHGPILPPMLLEALIGPTWVLNDWVEFDEGHWRTVQGFENALLAGNLEDLIGANGYVDPKSLTTSEAAFLQALLGMSQKLSMASAAFAASKFDCRDGFPSFWTNLGRGWACADEQITRIFRRFQQRLIDAESKCGSRAVVREADLRTAFSVEELPPSSEAISVRWAIEQVLSDDFGADEPEPDWRRARNFGRLTSLLLDRGLVSLAGAFHCFFTITQGFIVAGKAPRLRQGEDQQKSVDLNFVDDWALFAANTRRLLQSAWGERLTRTLKVATLTLQNEACADRLAFEARQLAAFLPEDATESAADAEVVDNVVHFAATSPGTPEYVLIESRLQEAMGKAFRDLPDWVCEALKSAERQFQISTGDRGVISRHSSSPWVMEYAKIVERLLREGLAILWNDAVLKTESEILYVEQNSLRKFPRSFEVGAALSVLAVARRSRPRGVISESLKEVGIDFPALSGVLGDEIRIVVSRVRNKEAHTEAPIEEANKLRIWVLENLPRLFIALGRPKGVPLRGNLPVP